MDLLKQAKEKFKIGIVFSNVNLKCGCENIKVNNNEFRENNYSISIYISNAGWYTIYDKLTKKWATIHGENKIYELW